MSNLEIRFHTNLDEAKHYVWDMKDWQHVPRVGDEISFPLARDKRYSFSLRVCAVTWRSDGKFVSVELHMPLHFQSIKDWMEYARRHIEGRGP